MADDLWATAMLDYILAAMGLLSLARGQVVWRIVGHCRLSLILELPNVVSLFKERGISASVIDWLSQRRLVHYLPDFFFKQAMWLWTQRMLTKRAATLWFIGELLFAIVFCACVGGHGLGSLFFEFWIFPLIGSVCRRLVPSSMVVCILDYERGPIFEEWVLGRQNCLVDQLALEHDFVVSHVLGALLLFGEGCLVNGLVEVFALGGVPALTGLAHGVLGALTCVMERLVGLGGERVGLLQF